MKKLIVYISNIPWDYAWHRQQEMMTKMSEAGYCILFIQPSTKKLWKSSFIQKTTNIWLLTPPGLPYERVLRSVHAINARLAEKHIKKAIKELACDEVIFWFDRVHGIQYEAFKNYFVVYDLIDELLAFGRVRNERMLISLENKVLRNADLVISSSKTLLDRKLQQCGGREDKGIFIPNGVDTARFETEKEWERIKNISYPRIGFVGTISQRSLDYDLIKAVAQHNPNWNFIFVGPGREEDKLKLQEDNIYVFEAVEGREIPEVVHSFDVGIIPYVCQGEDMDYVFPRKACEFLAAGLPTVSTPLPEIFSLSEYIEVAGSVEAFEEKIRECLSKTDKIQRKEYAKLFDWNVLMDSLIKKLRLIDNRG